MKVVVVESPAKAKTINRYLGGDYRVVASVGHVRDLPSKSGAVQPDDDFSLHWEVSTRGKEKIGDISNSLAGADKLILATDPDREGEAISWHICEVLAAAGALKGKPVERVVFNEITKTAILAAMEKPRRISQELVDAYLARRALDYLVGFGISPVLWKKLPGSRSAGRVQSVALKLICEREFEIEKFNPQEYWSVEARLLTKKKEPFTARLTHIDGKRLGKMALADEAAAKAAVAKVKAATLQVEAVDTKRTARHPLPPFTTSTMQQEASRKLGFGASRTMRVAQKLYEGVNIGKETTGLITYMRTDGVQIAGEAIATIRTAIEKDKGKRYLPDSPRVYKSKAANAQEAHEAVRPTDIRKKPQDLKPYLDEEQLKLYTLIWQRTLASQMASAAIDKTSVDIIDRDKGAVGLRATGSIIVFDGFLSVYRAGQDDTSKTGKADDAAEEAGDDATIILPAMKKGDGVTQDTITPHQHFTQPPPRFTDASLIKRLEELGIGRPSTYASILRVLQDRNYVTRDQRRFIPEDRGRIVTAFLDSFFTRYVEYDFTARLEDELDQVSAGQLAWKNLLHKFWGDFKAAIDATEDLTRKTILAKIDPLLEARFFPKGEDGKPVRTCSKCDNGVLDLQFGRFGPFIGCSNYPDCRYTQPIGEAVADAGAETLAGGDKELGVDEASGLPVLLRKGPYGIYVQRGEADAKKPKRCSVPKGMDIANIDLATALALLNLPREVGHHPDNNTLIQASIGRYGPYLKYGTSYISLPNDETVLTIGMNHAVELISNSGKIAGGSIGQHPDGGDILLKSGPFGPYVQLGDIRASIPKSMAADEIGLAEAVELIEKKKTQPKRSFKRRGGFKGKTRKTAKTS